MILLFTSDHCLLCNMIKGMLEEEEADIAGVAAVYEVNVDKHPFIAEAYGVMVVPALVAGCKALCGVPSESDLRSFLLQAAIGTPSHEDDNDLDPPLSSVHQSRLTKAGICDRICAGEPRSISTDATYSRSILPSTGHPKKANDEKEQPSPSLQG